MIVFNCSRSFLRHGSPRLVAILLALAVCSTAAPVRADPGTASLGTGIAFAAVGTPLAVVGIVLIPTAVEDDAPTIDRSQQRAGVGMVIGGGLGIVTGVGLILSGVNELKYSAFTVIVGPASGYVSYSF